MLCVKFPNELTTERLIYKRTRFIRVHYNDVIMDATASQITSLTIVYSTVYSGADQRKHQSSASLAFLRGIHRGPVNSPHKWPVTRKMFPFDDVMFSRDMRSRWFLEGYPIVYRPHSPVRLHGDVIKWKHFPRYWPFVRGIHRSRWIPLTKASDAELWCFLWSAPE